MKKNMRRMNGEKVEKEEKENEGTIKSIRSPKQRAAAIQFSKEN